MHPVVQKLIEQHRLEPLPVEGTLFAQTYRSAAELAPGQPAGTVMVGLYCEEPRSESLFHRLTLDEVWHFYGGDPFRLILLLFAQPRGSARIHARRIVRAEAESGPTVGLEPTVGSVRRPRDARVAQRLSEEVSGGHGKADPDCEASLCY
jgi:hypothetical protein